MSTTDLARTTAVLRARDGRTLPLPAQRWTGPATAVELRVLEDARSPVLDVGCGPARHVLALASAGIVTLGIDIADPALDLARARGAPVLRRSIFDRIPGAGRWGTALLLDGNIGIGGDPVALLERVATLLRPEGRILLEFEPEGMGAGVEHVRFETVSGHGPWFAWEHVTAERVDALADAAHLRVRREWTDEGRCFAALER